MFQIHYQERPFVRFKSLLGEQPETTNDLERHRDAVEAAVKFTAAHGLLQSTQRAHSNLLIIQNGILQDAATVAYSRAVAALESEHGSQVLKPMNEAYQARRKALEPDQARISVLNAECERAVNECHRAHSKAREPLFEERDRQVSALNLRLQAAQVFAEESGLPLDAEAAKIPGAIQAINEAVQVERERLDVEFQAQISRIKADCEAEVTPLRQRVNDEYRAIDAEYKAAQQTAAAALKKKCNALREHLEATWKAASEAQTAVYAELTASDRALTEAIKRHEALMKAARLQSADTLRTGILSLDAKLAVEVTYRLECLTPAEEAAVGTPPDESAALG